MSMPAQHKADECNDKQQTLIQEHMLPIWVTTVTTVTGHFMSLSMDGPTTQYRQKKNFFLFSTQLFELGFTAGSWNFFEASHGKGAADGVDAVLKRTADRLVRQGIGLPNPEQVFNQLSGTTSVDLYFVDSDKVDAAVQQFDLCNCNGFLSAAGTKFPLTEDPYL